MAKIKSVKMDSAYAALDSASNDRSEKNDCAVKAVAAATGESYTTVHDMMMLLGRVDGKGTCTAIIHKAIRKLGYKCVDSDGETVDAYSCEPFATEYFTDQYPGAGKKLKSVTTHHPDRYPNCPVWKGRTFLMLTAGGRHIVCIRDGVNIDWTRGKAQRAVKIWEVLPA